MSVSNISTNISASLAAIGSRIDSTELSSILIPLANRMRNVALTSAGLVIKAGGGTLAKTGAAAFYGVAEGTLITISAGTDMPALTGINVTNGNKRIVVFSADRAGVVSVQAGPEGGTTLGSAKFPTVAPESLIIGYVVIGPSSGNFVGGTSALDGTLANTIYISPVGAIWPAVNI